MAHHHDHDHDNAGRDERWLAATLPFVREHLPDPPGRVVEIGCGPLGGFVPAMRVDGYDAIGIDPEAPQGVNFHRIEFERYEVTTQADAVVACTSLHHVADLDEVLDRIASVLGPDGTLVVVEWAWEQFDETTANWCFDNIAADGRDHSSWLHGHREQWTASGQPWTSYLRGWAQDERLHSGVDIIGGLQARFDTRQLTEGPYCFADLDGITPELEQVAIDARQIQATGIRYVGESKNASSQAMRSSGHQDQL
jgi:SAM-dependent methyltransferase